MVVFIEEGDDGQISSPNLRVAIHRIIAYPVIMSFLTRFAVKVINS